MKIPAYLQINRYGIYHFRRAIPEKLRSIMGKREINLTLKTRNPRIAVQSARIVAFKVEKLFGELKTGMSKKGDTIKTEMIMECNFFDDGTLSSTKTEFTPEDITAMKDAGLSPDQITDVLKPSNNSTTPSHKQSPKTQQINILTISVLINKYKKYYLAKEGKNIIDNDETALRRLCEIMSNDSPCTDLTIEVADEIRDAIMRLPKYAKKFDGQHIHKIIEHNHEKTLAPITVANHIKMYSRLFKWAKKKRYYADEDPFEDLIPKFKRGSGRDTFTNDDLTQIFNGKIFTNFDPVKDKPHHYWAPLIGLFTGARISEIGALRIDDIKQIEGYEGKDPIWLFDFNTHGGEDKMKTEHSERQTPIHPDLLKLGIIDYYKRLKESGDIRFFNYLNKNSKGSYGRWIGEDFTDYLKDIEVHEETRKVFHSFRHTIATALERADVSDARIELICGRSSTEKPTTGRKHYIKHAEAQYLLTDLKKIDFSNQVKNVKPFMDMIK